MSYMDQVRATLDWIRGIRQDYRLTFQLNQPSNVRVLEDLALYCCATKTCVVHGDHDATLRAEGRRDVWLHLQEYLQLTEEQLWALKTGNKPLMKENEQ